MQHDKKFDMLTEVHGALLAYASGEGMHLSVTEPGEEKFVYKIGITGQNIQTIELFTDSDNPTFSVEASSPEKEEIEKLLASILERYSIQ